MYRELGIFPGEKTLGRQRYTPSRPGAPSPLDVIVPVQQLHVVILQPQVREAESAGQTNLGVNVALSPPHRYFCFIF